MTNFVQLYKSTDVGAPTLSGTAGTLITVFNAVLVNGYSTSSITSLTQTGGIATATIASNTTLETGNYLVIAGANETDYNGTVQITVANATSFSYSVSNNPSSPATGTITYKKAPLGWTSPFTGTNAAVYRSNDVLSNRFYLQVIDNAATGGGALEAQCMGFESMTAYNTGTRQFPTSAQRASGLCIRKATSTGATARAWTIIGDDKTFYFIPNTGDTQAFPPFGFGHYISLKANDNFNTFIAANSTFASTGGHNGLSATLPNFTTVNNSMFGARPWTGAASDPINVGVIPMGQSNTSGATNAPYGNATSKWMNSPNDADTGWYVLPAYQVELGVNPPPWRGKMPGLYIPLQPTPVSNYETMTNIAGLSGKTLIGLSASQTNVGTGMLLFDKYGPWV